MMSVLPELLQKLEEMNPDEQREVLEIIRMKSRPQGVSGERIIAWAKENPIDPEDLALMERAIEEGCEHV